jgi:hypothetical protein
MQGAAFHRPWSVEEQPAFFALRNNKGRLKERI